jgi:hypothetical protein
MMEEWRDIKGYEGLYQVSNHGRVKSLDRYINAKLGSVMFRKGAIMTLQVSHKGYNTIILHKKCKGSQFQVHRLVAMVFIPNPLNKPQVNHKDCNKKNNHAGNLEWATQNENMSHAVANGVYANFNEKQLAAVRKNQKKSVFAREIKVNQYDLDGTFITQHQSLSDAQRKTGANNSKICMCCKGKRKQAGGFSWKYAKEA